MKVMFYQCIESPIFNGKMSLQVLSTGSGENQVMIYCPLIFVDIVKEQSILIHFVNSLLKRIAISGLKITYGFLFALIVSI